MYGATLTQMNNPAERLRYIKGTDSRLEKTAMDPVTAGFLAFLKRNATIKHVHQVPSVMKSKKPLLGSKLRRASRALRHGFHDTGLDAPGTDALQTAIQTYGIDTTLGSVQNISELMGKAIHNIKRKTGTGFIHTPETINRLNVDLRSKKKNLLNLKKRIDEARSGGQGNDFLDALIEQRRNLALSMKKDMRELRKETQLGDLSFKTVRDEVINLSKKKAKEQGANEELVDIAGRLTGAKLNQVFKNVDPKTKMRRVQDMTAEAADASRKARYAEKDSKRSGLGRAIGRVGRKFVDPGATKTEALQDLLGKAQLDDVYDPMARRRDYATGGMDLRTRGMMRLGQGLNVVTGAGGDIIEGTLKGSKKAIDTALEPNAVSDVIESAAANRRMLKSQKRRLKRKRA